jgi:hypothetical protein
MNDEKEKENVAIPSPVLIPVPVNPPKNGNKNTKSNEEIVLQQIVEYFKEEGEDTIETVKNGLGYIVLMYIY